MEGSYFEYHWWVRIPIHYETYNDLCVEFNKAGRLVEIWFGRLSHRWWQKASIGQLEFNLYSPFQIRHKLNRFFSSFVKSIFKQIQKASSYFYSYIHHLLLTIITEKYIENFCNNDKTLKINILVDLVISIKICGFQNKLLL